MEVETKPDDKIESKPADSKEPEDDAEPLLEPVVEDEPAPEPKVHPLAPKGRRFEQVYAQGKQAQREAQELRERLLAAETKIELLSGSKKAEPAETEYSWPQLEEFIAQGKITRGEAEAHREEIIARRVANKVKGDYGQELRQTTRTEALSKNINDYVAVVPAILQEDSADRQRLDEELDWLASVQGVDSSKISDSERKALQLTALRNVYGPIDSLTKRTASPKRETQHELPGGTPPRRSTNKDQALLDGLTLPQVTHYKKMMNAGRYRGGWKDVVEELKFDKSKRSR